MDTVAAVRNPARLEALRRTELLDSPPEEQFDRLTRLAANVLHTTVALITLVAFLQFNTLEMTAAAGGWAGLVAVLEGNLISPWLTSRAGELNTVAVFVSVLFWGWMWDVWGLVLAIPIMVAIKAAADHIEPLQPLGELLGR